MDVGAEAATPSRWPGPKQRRGHAASPEFLGELRIAEVARALLSHADQHPGAARAQHLSPGQPGQALAPLCCRRGCRTDLRLGYLRAPWEESLCVSGDDLLAEVADELTDLPGTDMRLGGRNEGNIWTFGPDAGV